MTFYVNSVLFEFDTRNVGSIMQTRLDFTRNSKEKLVCCIDLTIRVG